MNEDKPTAWARKWYLDGEIPQKEKNERGRMVWPLRFKFLPVTVHKCLEDDVPLYRPPNPQKPMTDKEINDSFWSYMETSKCAPTFRDGISIAERHHGIK